MPASSRGRFAFFLGGRDLEMLTIRDLLMEVAPHAVFDKNLQWGAKASAYRDEIRQAIAQGLEPVLVELHDDLGIPAAHVVVDHHGDRAGHDASTSLEQVFSLLGLPLERWTRRLELVAANDRGHVRELRRIGATEDEIAEIRAADRAAQGITEDEERSGEEAIRNARSVCHGRLMIAMLPHNRTAVVADRLELRPDPPENVLVLSPAEANFYGSGVLVAVLNAGYPGGWMGGSLPERGYWGIAPPPLDLVPFLVDAVNREGTG